MKEVKNIQNVAACPHSKLWEAPRGSLALEWNPNRQRLQSRVLFPGLSHELLPAQEQLNSSQGCRRSDAVTKGQQPRRCSEKEWGTQQAELQAAALAQPHHLAPPRLCWGTGFQGRSCHSSGSAVALCWAQPVCSVGVHVSWQLTYRDDGCSSLVKASSVPWVLQDQG